MISTYPCESDDILRIVAFVVKGDEVVLALTITSVNPLLISYQIQLLSLRFADLTHPHPLDTKSVKGLACPGHGRTTK
jgi:hypothetical protein